VSRGFRYSQHVNNKTARLCRAVFRFTNRISYSRSPKRRDHHPARQRFDLKTALSAGHPGGHVTPKSALCHRFGLPAKAVRVARLKLIPEQQQDCAN
jgi:hypothetical protein